MSKHQEPNYVEVFEHFAKKFDCAVKTIRSKNIYVHDRIENKFIRISGQFRLETGQVRVHGPQYPVGHWCTDQKVILAAPNHLHRRIHPFAFMMEGKFSHSYSYEGNPDIRRDIEYTFGFPREVISGAFCQGYFNNAGYKDCWAGTGHHWTLSAAFNFGRYLLAKHVVPQAPLMYTTPEKLRKIMV